MDSWLIGLLIGLLNGLLNGLNDKEVATELEISRQTVTNCRNHDSTFMAYLNSERKQANQERLRSLMDRAIGYWVIA